MLEITQLRFGYPFGKPLFDGLELSLQPGSLAGLLGLNGAGKTTLLKLICGLQRPDKGSCRLRGRDTSGRALAVLQDLAFVSEDTDTPALTIDGYVAWYAPFYPRFDHAQFRANLEILSMHQLTKRKLSSCSLGEKRKCLLAFALATNTPLLLLDEPMNGLDIPAKTALRRLLAAAVHEERAIMVSTHQVRELGLLLDPVIILDGGKTLLNASIADLSAKLSFSYDPTPLPPVPGSCLHAEPCPGGWQVVRENHDGIESQPDLETLFAAVLANPVRFQELFPLPVSAAR
jgi:ABC-2 type transport system ATP-binding protein